MLLMSAVQTFLSVKQNPWWNAVTVEILRKVATYHKPSSRKAKRKLYTREMESPAAAGLLFVLWNTMDKIYECAESFRQMTDKKYFFVVSLNRNVVSMTLDFKITDFRHIAGLQYIDDINIGRNPAKLVDSILNKSVTDELLSKSRKYSSGSLEGGSVRSRVEELCWLERYLDAGNFIRIYKVQEFGSRIKADYFIEASDPARRSAAYIFFRKRMEDDNYVVVSFFKKASVTYKGINLYWMLKEKHENGKVVELYRHPNFKG